MKQKRWLMVFFGLFLLLQWIAYFLMSSGRGMFVDTAASIAVSLALWWFFSALIIRVANFWGQTLLAFVIGLLVIGPITHIVYILAASGTDILVRDLAYYWKRNGAFWFLPLLAVSFMRLTWLLCVISVWCVRARYKFVQRAANNAGQTRLN